MRVRLLNDLWREEEGQDLIEYSLLLGFVALVAVSVLASIQTSITKLWKDVSNALSDAITGAG